VVPELVEGFALGLVEGLGLGLVEGFRAGLVEGLGLGLVEGFRAGLVVGLVAGLVEGTSGAIEFPFSRRDALVGLDCVRLSCSSLKEHESTRSRIKTDEDFMIDVMVDYNFFNF